MIKKNIFHYFTEKLLSFPLSLKQIIFSILYEDLKNTFTETVIFEPEEDNFYTTRPQLTIKGIEELNNRNMGFDQNLYSFLECCQSNLSLMEISINKFFTIEEVAKYLIFAVEQGCVEKDFSQKVNAMAGFLAGKYRIGEYFLHNGKISDEQISEIIDMQKNLVQTGVHIMFAELLLKKGYIEEKDIRSIFMLKAEATKRFFIDINTVSDFPSIQTTIRAEGDVVMLKEENDLLKKKLNQLLKYYMDTKDNLGK